MSDSDRNTSSIPNTPSELSAACDALRTELEVKPLRDYVWQRLRDLREAAINMGMPDPPPFRSPTIEGKRIALNKLSAWARNQTDKHEIPTGGPEDEPISPAVFQHSDDYQEIQWGDKSFQLSPKMAQAVKKLYEACRKNPDTPSLAQADVCGTPELKQVFRRRSKGDIHPAFGTMIKVKKGRAYFVPPQRLRETR